MVRGTAVPRVDRARDPQLRRWRQLDAEYLCTRIRRSGELTLTYRPSSVSRRELAALVDVEQQCWRSLNWLVIDTDELMLVVRGRPSDLDAFCSSH